MTSAGSGDPGWVTDVLTFWFGEVGPELWFAKDAALDATIRARFGALHASLAAGTQQPQADSPRAMLAAVIATDQLPRNMYRGTPRAYESDVTALRWARDATDHGLDSAMNTEERQFLYMPFQHSEDRADQARSVQLVRALGNDEWTRYALAHRDIIERFGRFPHRNAVLGRTSTPDELRLLDDPMGSF
jgi:uncharacterized protein (DUF924 family)